MTLGAYVALYLAGMLFMASINYYYWKNKKEIEDSLDWMILFVVTITCIPVHFCLLPWYLGEIIAEKLLTKRPRPRA